jgi:glycosyltransferase involved in cell wall biosynthesis
MGDEVINNCPFVLITPARNEEVFIERTLESVIKQTVLPERWVIVNDGSTDSTAVKIRPYLANHPWINLVDLPVRRERHFAAKVHAFNAGAEQVKELSYEVIGNLDADVSLEHDHFEFLIDKFRKDPDLGVAGTIFREEGYSSDTDSYEGEKHVAGACQLFRRACFEAIGGYLPNKAGGIDWIAVTTARMKGWKTRSFRERSMFHYRKLGTAERGRLASSFSYGEKDYYLGGHPLWELFRVAYRMTKRPYIVDGVAVGFGYVWALLHRGERPISRDLVRFHRKEQMQKLRGILVSLLTLKRVNSFQIKPNSDAGQSS